VNWIRTVAPSLVSLGVDEARAQCEIPADLTDRDDLLQSLIAVGDAACENYTNRGLLSQTWKATTDDWFDELALPMAAPVQSVSSVKYYAPDGTLTTVASSAYLLDSTSEPATLRRAPNMTWPALQSDRKALVEVTYIVGWNAAELVPAPLKHGVRLLIAHLFANREAVNVGNIVGDLPFGVEALWAPYRVWLKPMVCA
jgi:uncharacterized phiE125 gp8 family phage protein